MPTFSTEQAFEADVEQHHTEAAAEQIGGDIPPEKSGQCRKENTGEGGWPKGPALYIFLPPVPKEGRRRTAEEKEQIHPGGGALRHPRHGGEVEQQEGAAAHAAPADDAGCKANEDLQPNHKSSTAFTPPYKRKPAITRRNHKTGTRRNTGPANTPPMAPPNK